MVAALLAAQLWFVVCWLGVTVGVTGNAVTAERSSSSSDKRRNSGSRRRSSKSSSKIAIKCVCSTVVCGRSQAVRTAVTSPYAVPFEPRSDRAMAQAVSCRFPTAEAWGRSQTFPYGPCSGQSGTGKACPLSALHQYCILIYSSAVDAV
jgi:hypothetical protein